MGIGSCILLPFSSFFVRGFCLGRKFPKHTSFVLEQLRRFFFTGAFFCFEFAFVFLFAYQAEDRRSGLFQVSVGLLIFSLVLLLPLSILSNMREDVSVRHG